MVTSGIIPSPPRPRVLVTRSEPGASETARRLGNIGYDAVVEPLFALETLAAPLPPFDALAFTSANGVRSLAGLTPRRDAPVFAVGARTAEAAREAGFSRVASAEGDVSDLAALILERLPPQASLLHAGNEESRGDLAGALTSAGRLAEFVALYRAMAVAQPGPALAAHLSGAQVLDAALLHSPRAAHILAAFVHHSIAPPIAAISDAAAGPVREIAMRIEIAASPNENSLIEALNRLLQD